ncbi:MAG TPA: hypothetical protein VIN40_08000 [Candidatus Tyrphobacter sp.]
MSDKNDGDAPLVGTFRFVIVMGVSFALLWFALLWLLKERW